MDKRYQVFLSSTYVDLGEERRKVIQTLMEMDCIPSGMELFPAADEDQWEFIKKVIDDCDYYIIIIGGRYGSVDSAGISYTEKEYDYAVEKGLHVLRFLHADPKAIPAGKSELDPQSIRRLSEFREKVSAGRLVKTWTNPDELVGLVSLSLNKAIKTYPAIGWVRANSVASEDSLRQLNELRQENAQLLRRFEEFGKRLEIPDIASLDEKLRVVGTYFESSKGTTDWECEMSWSEIFGLIAPHIGEKNSEYNIRTKLCSSLVDRIKDFYDDCSIDENIFQTIKIQFEALGLIQIRHVSFAALGQGVIWMLTPAGRSKMHELRVVRTASPDSIGPD